MIRFVRAKYVRPAEIHRQIVEEYGEGAINEGCLRKWCRLFKHGRTNVRDGERIGRPSLVTDYLKENVNANFRKNRKFIIAPTQIFFRPESEE
jgi:hypothetical protein